LIVVADHGMTEMAINKKIVILDYLKPNWLEQADVINPL
jgi:alkaline phosphatase D